MFLPGCDDISVHTNFIQSTLDMEENFLAYFFPYIICTNFRMRQKNAKISIKFS